MNNKKSVFLFGSSIIFGINVILLVISCSCSSYTKTTTSSRILNLNDNPVLQKELDRINKINNLKFTGEFFDETQTDNLISVDHSNILSLVDFDKKEDFEYKVDEVKIEKHNLVFKIKVGNSLGNKISKEFRVNYIYNPSAEMKNIINYEDFKILEKGSYLIKSPNLKFLGVKNNFLYVLSHEVISENLFFTLIRKIDIVKWKSLSEDEEFQIETYCKDVSISGLLVPGNDVAMEKGKWQTITYKNGEKGNKFNLDQLKESHYKAAYEAGKKN